MEKVSRISAFVSLVLLLAAANSYASNLGLFRTVPVETPKKGTLRVSNTSFYSPIPANSVLKERYGVSDTRIFSSLTNIELGITDHVALKGTLPFYADLFSQGDRSGEKTGPGDVSVGLKMSFGPEKALPGNFSIGAGVCIPEEFGYGGESLGFRTFSTGEFSYSADISFTFNLKLLEGNFSASYYCMPYAKKSEEVHPRDIFYDSGYGYLGIGKSDAGGLAEIIFQNHATVSLGTALPITSWLSGIVEASATSFVEKPERDTIVRAAPGIRLGRPERVHLCAGMDYRISGSIPDRTCMLRVNIPFFHPRALKKPVRKKPVPDSMIRSRNALVAVKDFSVSDITCLYQDELKDAFHRELETMGIMEVIPREKVDKAFIRLELVPRKDTPGRIGVRLGANYLINTDISEYTVERKSSSAIPFVIGFPGTTFSLTARASVTDLVTGETHDLGDVSAQVNRSRGVNLFPLGVSSDIVYLSEPERRRMEKELIDRWVGNFNKVIFRNLEIFGWKPKQDETRGDEDLNG